MEILNYPALLIEDGKVMIYGGLWDGRLTILATDTDQILETYDNHTSTVSALAVDREETYIISGDFL